MKYSFTGKIITGFAILIFGVAFFISNNTSQKNPDNDQIVGKQSLPSKDVIPAFSAMTNVVEKKKAFFEFIRPGIVNANRKVALDRQYLLDLKENINLDSKAPQRYLTLLMQYKVKATEFNRESITQLLTHVDTIPHALIMVQAANESSWGTSRFARLGLNFFGQWCFKKGCGLVPNSRNKDATHEVQAFKSVDESIDSYLMNLNTHAAYRHLRDIRAQLRTHNETVTAEKLAQGLVKYSERGDDYVLELLQMLRHNKAYL